MKLGTKKPRLLESGLFLFGVLAPKRPQFILAAAIETRTPVKTGSLICDRELSHISLEILDITLQIAYGSFQ